METAREYRTTPRSGPKIAAVVVTRNRLELLKECIAALRVQTRVPDEIIVVDNESDDGTADWLKAQGDLKAVRQENGGSSGGQYRGLTEALQLGSDWIWLMDDDSIPSPNALALLVASEMFARPDTGFLCSDVVWTDGAPHLMNRPEVVPDYFKIREALPAGAVPVTCASFVSLLVSRKAVESCGLPLRDMFIWGDDIEFTCRIANRFKAYAVPASRVLHKTARNYCADLLQPEPADFAKLQFGMRNYIHNELKWRRPSLKSRLTLLFLAGKIAIGIWRRCPASEAMNLTQALVYGFFYAPEVEFPNREKGTEDFRK